LNTFGSSTLQLPLYDADQVIASRARFRRAVMADLYKVNHFYCPSGRYPFLGYILLARSDYDRLNKYSTTFQLNIGNTTKPDNVGTLKNLSIVQAQCATRGLAADNNALYLVEITDARGILHNEWMQFPITSAYNIRSAAYPQTFQPGSMNSGTTWTWSTMLQNIWEQMPLLGTWPGLPFTPSGTPEGWWFTGVSAWHSLCDVLEHIGMIVACDLQATSPFTIVQQNATDTAYTTLTTRYNDRVEEDLEWIDIGAARVPGTVKVLFRRRNSAYGTEETVRYDSPQWNMSTVYSVTINAPSDFTGAVGTHHIWSDYTIRYDTDGSPLAADVVTATTIANERVTQYYNVVSALACTSRTYSGALPFTTGSKVDGVHWAMDRPRDSRLGWTTEVVYGSSPPWPGIW
jgi:hypothetical protein